MPRNSDVACLPVPAGRTATVRAGFPESLDHDVSVCEFGAICRAVGESRFTQEIRARTSGLRTGVSMKRQTRKAANRTPPETTKNAAFFPTCGAKAFNEI